MSIGYWSHNKYYRMNVEELVTEFCGWKPLTDLISYAQEGRDQAFLTALFQTGGRVSEVLALMKRNFMIRSVEGVVVVTDMILLKRYKKLSEYVDSEGSRKWETEKLLTKRKQFPIKIAEPLTPILLKWLDHYENLLFPSPYKLGPLSRWWAYKLVRHLDKVIPEKLRTQLDLNKPLIKNGKEVKHKLNLWLHWFRSQRASQLVDNYNYEVLDLVDYFSWKKQDTALIYARRGWRGLASKMQATQITYV